MGGLLEVIDGGIGNSIQDAGRFGVRHVGIAVSGYLDPLLARSANALAGNDSDGACIEIRAVGPALQVKQGPLRVALAGEAPARLTRANGEARVLPAWTSFTLFPDDVLKFSFMSGGTAYLAFGGGLTTSPQLGSRATYQRALIGGIDGQMLKKGQFLPCAVLAAASPERQAAPWRHVEEGQEGPIRVMLGPQAGHFTDESVFEFMTSEFLVTKEMDRMGMRLDGPTLRHVTQEAADIVSDGVAPGAIQVPGNGRPIILLLDCQTVGGYPKIATVITADLPRLAQFRPGQTLRFTAVTAAEAKRALLARETRWREWAGGIQTIPSAA